MTTLPVEFTARPCVPFFEVSVVTAVQVVLLAAKLAVPLGQIAIALPDPSILISA